MIRQLWLLLIAAMLVLPSLTFAQSLAFQFDIGGTDTGLYSHTPSNPNDGSWTYLGGTIPLPTVEEEADVVAMDADSNGLLFGVDVYLNILGTINPVNGDFTTIAPLSGNVPPNVQAMTIDGFDVAWVSDGDGLWMMDLSTGMCTLVAAQFTDTADGSAVHRRFCDCHRWRGKFLGF